MTAKNQKGAQSTGGRVGNGVKATTGSTSAQSVGSAKKPVTAAGKGRK